MSRDVGVTDIQNAIADIRAWANGSGYLPEGRSDMLRAMADLLEALLVQREDSECIEKIGKTVKSV